MTKLKVLGISGSLRKNSYNRKLLQIAESIATELGAEVAEADLKTLNLPIYDGDIEAQGMPAPVQELRKMVEAADVLLIASPEYNYSVSGALKNAIDWLSRQGNILNGKVAAIFGASSGTLGTIRGQLHLRQILGPLNVLILPVPQVLVAQAQEAFNEDGSLKNPKTYELLKDLTQKTLDLAQKLK